MPTFNSVAELELYVVQRMHPAVRAVQERVHQIIQKYLEQFYGEYQPSVAIRTWQVFNSLVKTAVVRSGKGWEGEVYFDLGALSHPSSYIGQDGRTVTKGWSEGAILASVMVGATHGGATGGVPVWTNAMGEINPQWVSWFKQELIAAGIPVQ